MFRSGTRARRIVLASGAAIFVLMTAVYLFARRSNTSGDPERAAAIANAAAPSVVVEPPEPAPPEVPALAATPDLVNATTEAQRAAAGDTRRTAEKSGPPARPRAGLGGVAASPRPEAWPAAMGKSAPPSPSPPEPPLRQQEALARPASLSPVNAALQPVASPPPNPEPSAAEATLHAATPAALDVSKASVDVAAITTTAGISAAKVRAALGRAQFTACYRRALTGRTSAAPLVGSLRLAIDMTGRVVDSALTGDADLPGLRSCVQSEVRGMQIRDVDTGDGSATISLSFSPR